MFEPVTESVFNAFIAMKEYKTKVVEAGPATITVYYDEPEYNPSDRDAFKTEHPGGVDYHIKVSN